MSIKISLTDCTEILDYSKSCAANATKNKLGADTSKNFLLRAEKLDDDNSSASIDEITEKRRQTAIYRANNASAQVNNQVKGNDKQRSAEKLDDDNSSASIDEITEKLRQTAIYRANNASAQNNQVKENDKNRMKKLFFKRKIYVATKEVIYNIKNNFKKFAL